MKPVLEYLPPHNEESFFAHAFELPYFDTPWHYHPEYELVLVTASSGRRFIGNTVSDFSAGDLSLLGPNLPHLYRNCPSYYEAGSALKAKSVIIHFSEQSFGGGLLALPEAKQVGKLLHRSKTGVDIHGKTKEAVVARLHQLLKATGLQRLLLLLDILHCIAESKDYQPISETNMFGYNSTDAERLTRVLDYLLNHFQQNVRLEDVAKLVHLTPTSFCRFFKERTKRSFGSYLINLRLGHAKKLLSENRSSIEHICYDSGYNNLSNFNRQFRDRYGISPSAYRKVYAAA